MKEDGPLGIHMAYSGLPIFKKGRLSVNHLPMAFEKSLALGSLQPKNLDADPKHQG